MPLSWDPAPARLPLRPRRDRWLASPRTRARRRSGHPSSARRWFGPIRQGPIRSTPPSTGRRSRRCAAGRTSGRCRGRSPTRLSAPRPPTRSPSQRPRPRSPAPPRGRGSRPSRSATWCHPRSWRAPRRSRGSRSSPSRATARTCRPRSMTRGLLSRRPRPRARGRWSWLPWGVAGRTRREWCCLRSSRGSPDPRPCRRLRCSSSTPSAGLAHAHARAGTRVDSPMLPRHGKPNRYQTNTGSRPPATCNGRLAAVSGWGAVHACRLP